MRRISLSLFGFVAMMVACVFAAQHPDGMIRLIVLLVWVASVLTANAKEGGMSEDRPFFAKDGGIEWRKVNGSSLGVLCTGATLAGLCFFLCVLYRISPPLINCQ